MSFYEFPHTRTYDNDLGWLIKHCRSNTEAIKVLNEWKKNVDKDFQILDAIVSDIEKGIIPDSIAAGIKTWIANNFYDIVGMMIKTVWFGLTDSGYFVAYIPKSWKDIIFKTTGYDIELELMPEYGHLVLQAKVGGIE